jgi:hypothetical protein
MNEQRQFNRPMAGNQAQNQARNTTNRPPAVVTRTASRGAAIRAQKRNAEMATKLAGEYLDASDVKLKRRANVIDA